MAKEDRKIRILVLCSGNACRSQIAEGIIRARYGDRVEVFSAGVTPADRVHPYAIETLKEIKIDISRAKPKDVMQFANEEFDIVITTCDHAQQTCPVFPGSYEKLHWSLPDPGNARGCAAEIKEEFRDTITRINRRLPELERIMEEIENQ